MTPLARTYKRRYCRYMAKSMHNMRIDDDVWAAAKARARNDFTSVTAVVEHALRIYAGMPTAELEAKLGPMDAAVRAFRPYPKERQTGRSGKR